jgi:hypothetical protein
MPLGTTAPGPPRPSVRWVRAPRTGRGRARGAPRTSPYSTPYRARLQARIAARPGNGCSRCVRKHRRHARPSRPPTLVSARTSRRCYARACSRTPSARPRRPKTDAKGGCSLGHPFDPVTIPHDIENRGVATRIDQERNPQVSGAFQRSPQVTGSARLNLSRWRHGFEPRWDYPGQRPYSGATRTCGPALAPRRTALVTGHCVPGRPADGAARSRLLDVQAPAVESHPVCLKRNPRSCVAGLGDRAPRIGVRFRFSDPSRVPESRSTVPFHRVHHGAFSSEPPESALGFSNPSESPHVSPPNWPERLRIGGSGTANRAPEPPTLQVVGLFARRSSRTGPSNEGGADPIARSLPSERTQGGPTQSDRSGAAPVPATASYRRPPSHADSSAWPPGARRSRGCRSRSSLSGPRSTRPRGAGGRARTSRTTSPVG